MERRKGVGVVKKLPVGTKELTVLLIEIELGGELIMMADENVWPAVAVEVGDCCAAVLETGATPTLETDGAGYVDEGGCGCGGEEKSL